MPLDQVAQRYAQTLFVDKLEELTRRHATRAAEVRAELGQRGMFPHTAGHYHAEMTRIGIEHIGEIANAKVDSLLAAYEQARLPIDDGAVADIRREAVEWTQAQGRNLTANIRQQVDQARVPSGVADQMAATITHGISAIDARILRRLSAKRDEEILAARAAPESKSRTDVREAMGLGSTLPASQHGQAAPWYESNLLWGPLGFAVAILLTVIAAMKKDLQWLLFLVWPCSSVALWAICKSILSRRAVFFVTVVGSLIIGVGLYKLDVWLSPSREVSPIAPPIPSTVPQAAARIRIANVVIVPMSTSGAPFPAVSIHYDNVGTLPATGIVNHFAAGFGGAMSDDAVRAEQDKLLKWDGWDSAMERRQQYEMYQGDAGEFTSIPSMEGVLAEQFRANFDKVAAGTKTLYILIAFKYLDPSIPKKTVRVTEDCFWFSGNFARHNCGRGRAFLEQQVSQ
jgi:hypothetical protein